MRTFPRQLAKFRELVNDRGAKLRTLSREALEEHATEPVEHLTVDGRQATIAIIVQSMADGSRRVVVQGFMKNRFLPGSSVALDGFYKHPDGSVSPMPDEEFFAFD